MSIRILNKTKSQYRTTTMGIRSEIFKRGVTRERHHRRWNAWCKIKQNMTQSQASPCIQHTYNATGIQSGHRHESGNTDYPQIFITCDTSQLSGELNRRSMNKYCPIHYVLARYGALILAVHGRSGSEISNGDSFGNSQSAINCPTVRLPSVSRPSGNKYFIALR